MPVQIKTSRETYYKKFISKFNNFEGCEERNDLPDDQLDSTKYKLAFCGKCKYNNEIKEYHIKNFYPYCSCITNENFRLRKSSFFHTDDFGFELSRELELDGKKIKICPRGYTVFIQNIYDLMIFESSNGKSELEILKAKENHIEKLIKIYEFEAKRLNSLYDSLSSKIYHTFTFELLLRNLKVQDIDDMIDDLMLTKFRFSIKISSIKSDEMKKMQEERRKEFEEWKRKIQDEDTEDDEDSNNETLEEHYSILGFKNIKTNLPTEEEVKKNYKKMVSKFHPDENLEVDTTEIFTKISRSYEIISFSRKFN